MLLYFLFPAREGYLRGQRDANIRVGAHDRKDLLGEVDSGSKIDTLCVGGGGFKGIHSVILKTNIIILSKQGLV